MTTILTLIAVLLTLGSVLLLAWCVGQLRQDLQRVAGRSQPLPLVSPEPVVMAPAPPARPLSSAPVGAPVGRLTPTRICCLDRHRRKPRHLVVDRAGYLVRLSGGEYHRVGQDANGVPQYVLAAGNHDLATKGITHAH